MVGELGFALGFNMSSGSFGKGGDIYYVTVNYGGGSGGYDTAYFNVTPGESYKIVVGAGGSRRGGADIGWAQNGSSGFVLIAYGGDI